MRPDDEFLLAFLKDWLGWVERGAPDHEPYSRGHGLCANAQYRFRTPRPYDATDALIFRLNAEFGMDEYPFREGGLNLYHERWANRVQHENPERLAWVRKVIAELEKEIGQ